MEENRRKMSDDLFGLIGVIIVISVICAPTASAGTHEAGGGNITSINFTVYSTTNYWQGYYSGPIQSGIDKYPDFFIKSRTNASTVYRVDTGVQFRPGEYILATTAMPLLHLSDLRAGNVSGIDLITGTGSDSGTNTFTAIDEYRNIIGIGDISNVPTAHVGNFREGLLQDINGNLVFIIPIDEKIVGYDGGLYNFQFLLPTNATNPLTYYLYYLSGLPSPTPAPAPGHHHRTHPPPVAPPQNVTQQQILVFNTTGIIFSDGKGILQRSEIIYTADRRASLYIQSGTQALTADKRHLEKVTITSVNDIPPPPASHCIFADHAVETFPSGATFEPPIDLTFYLTEEEWNASEKEQTFVIKCHNAITGDWENCSTSVDPNTRTVTGKIDHFSIFALTQPTTTVLSPTESTPDDSFLGGLLLVFLRIGSILALILIPILGGLYLSKLKNRSR
jgi:hypothetical protein